jgi:hypothetical protein
MAVPDMDNMETVDRITTNGGTWTADRSGYISVTLAANNTESLGYLFGEIFINGKPVASETTVYDADANKKLRFSPPPIEIHKGDTVKLSVEARDGAVPLDVFYHCYFIPPKFTRLAAPVISDEDFSNYMPTPDEDNIDTTELITADDGEWVADRTGYVICEVEGVINNELGSIRGNVIINGVVMGYNQGNAKTFNQARGRLGPYPVAVGDIVKLQLGAYNGATITPQGFHCYFMPPKFVRLSAPVISDENFRNIRDIPNYDEQHVVFGPNAGSWLNRDVNLLENSFVAPSSGYVQFISFNNQAGSGSFSLSIDGGSVVQEQESNSLSVRMNRHYGPFAVKKGAVIAGSISGDLQISFGVVCYFIPVEFEEVAGAPTSTDIGYSLAEQDTGTTWSDRKKIYKKTYVHDVATFSSVETSITLDLPAIGQHVRMESDFIGKNSPNIRPANWTALDVATGEVLTDACVNVHVAGNKLVFRSADYAGWVNYNLVTTLWYTKA